MKIPGTWQSTMEWPPCENCIFDLFKKVWRILPWLINSLPHLPAVCSLPRLTGVSWNSAAFAKLLLTTNLITHHFCQCLYLIQEKQFHIWLQWGPVDSGEPSLLRLFVHCWLKVPSANMPQCLQSVCCLPSPFLGLSPEEAPGIIISWH